MVGAAENWVRSNVMDQKLTRQTVQFLNASAAAGLDCSFAVGGDLTRSGSAAVLNCFAGEVFIHQLTDAQAAAMGVGRDGTSYSQRNKRSAVMRPPARVAVSFDRLEMLSPTLTPATPIVGRLHYNLLAEEPRDVHVHRANGGDGGLSWDERWTRHVYQQALAAGDFSVAPCAVKQVAQLADADAPKAVAPIQAMLRNQQAADRALLAEALAATDPATPPEK